MTKKSKTQELQEMTDTCKRLQAEFENYKKRTQKESEDFRRFASSELIQKILPLVDNFELAIKNKENKDEFIKGMQLIYSQLLNILEDEGLQRIESVGQAFDPYYHEALMAVESEEEPNTIIEEFQKGYKLNDKVLRHAKVKVSKGAQTDRKEDTTKDHKETGQ